MRVFFEELLEIIFLITQIVGRVLLTHLKVHMHRPHLPNGEPLAVREVPPLRIAVGLELEEAVLSLGLLLLEVLQDVDDYLLFSLLAFYAVEGLLGSIGVHDLLLLDDLLKEITLLNDRLLRIKHRIEIVVSTGLRSSVVLSAALRGVHGRAGLPRLRLFSWSGAHIDRL